MSVRRHHLPILCTTITEEEESRGAFFVRVVANSEYSSSLVLTRQRRTRQRRERSRIGIGIGVPCTSSPCSSLLAKHNIHDKEETIVSDEESEEANS